MGHWVFPKNDADEDEGLANAGIEFFRDSPYSGIARECGQNSLDAAQVDPLSGESLPVLLRFHRKTISTDLVPALPQLEAAISACLSRAKARHEDKEEEFFFRAINLLSKDRIDVLQISDFGTKGLRGPSMQGTPFHALVKSSGVSEKGDKSAGGSFGIGKNAAYAISAIRTVFYSTWYQDKPAPPVFLCQGKAILASHQGTDELPRRAAGYWGAKNYQPIESPDALPDWLQRNEQGTTVSAVGFVGEPNWHYQIAGSLIRNFFAAIHRGSVSFHIDDVETLDRDHIGGLFQLPEIVDASEAHGHGEDLRFAMALHECLTSSDAVETEETFLGLGVIRLRLLVKDGMPKRVALLRNGMYITDSLQHFGDRLARFALQRDFVAIIEPVDKETGQVIRELENPRHDELSPERVENPQRQRQVKSAFKKLIIWMRDFIKAQTTTATSDQILLDELNQFFTPPDAKDEMADAEGKDEDPNKLKVEKLRSRPVRSPSLGKEGEQGGQGGKKRNKSQGGRTGGTGAGHGGGGKGKQGGLNLRIEEVRNQSVGKNRSLRKIYFTPEYDGQARLYIEAPGISSPERLLIKAIDGEHIGAEWASVSLASGKRFSAEVQFYVDYQGPIEIGVVSMEEPRNEA